MKYWQIAAMCGLLLLVGIKQSFWLDEAISVQTASKYSYYEIIGTFSPHDFHPPLYYLTLKTWMEIFGNSEIVVRMLSVVFTLATVYFVYKIGGSGAALLVGLNPLIVYYAQEARMYSMVTCLLTGALYAYIKKKYFLYNLFTALGLLTFYGSIFFPAAITIHLIYKKRFKDILVYNIGVIFALIIISPLLSQQLVYSKEMLQTVSNWDLVLGKANLKNILLIPMKFTSGRISFYPKVVYYLISGIFAIYVMARMLRRNVYVFIFGATLIIGVLFSIFTPMLQYFRFLYLIPLMALAINKSRSVTVGFLIFSSLYLLNTTFHREDWKHLSSKLGGEVYMIQSFADPVNYYSPHTKICDIRGTIQGDIVSVIPYGEAIHGVDHNKILQGQGYKKVETKNFREVTIETWQKTT